MPPGIGRAITAEVTVVGVVTRDRPADIAGCVESYLENAHRHGRAPEFVVVDDSSKADTQDRTREALEEPAHRFGANIRYAGRAQKRRFAQALADESAVPLPTIQFALLGDRRCALTAGANRNCLLLDTVDSLALSVDDDTVCEIAPAPGLEEGTSYSSEYDPTEFWFFPDRASARGAVSFADVDLLACHAALLGESGPAGAGGRVAITMHGLVGDSGMGSPRYYFTLAGASRERFVASAEAYRSALTSREVLRTVRRPTVSSGSFCMTGFFGFDNRSLLPPFLPVQRNSDGIFGLLLQRCFDASRVAFLPWVLHHAPTALRGFGQDEIWGDATGVRLADVVIDAVLAQGPPGPSLPDAARLSYLGARLKALGSSKPAEFEAHIRAVQQHRTAAYTAILRSRLQAHAALPAFWAADVQRMIDVLLAAPAAQDFVVPRDLRDGRDVEGARQLSRELVAAFGDLLDGWPRLVAAARRLRVKGDRLSDPIARG